MRLLLLGGPRFLGRAVIDAALDAGHEVTLFNRGTTNADLYPDLERITGDRDGGLDGLRGRDWDAVVDTSGYLPRLVGASADALRDSVGHYVFVSSISVYASFAEVADEQGPVAQLSEPGSEDIGRDYGALKALCEQEVERALPGRAAHVRAGLIVGPHDPTGRFTYWPHRLARGASSPAASVDKSIRRTLSRRPMPPPARGPSMRSSSTCARAVPPIRSLPCSSSPTVDTTPGPRCSSRPQGGRSTSSPPTTWNLPSCEG